jgi:hypothetical protein
MISPIGYLIKSHDDIVISTRALAAQASSGFADSGLWGGVNDGGELR